MREIKFRAYEKAYNIIREVVSINFADKTVVLKDDFFDDVRLLNFDDVNLMQYTGCKDKNSIEIYEGDILSFKSAHSDYAYKTIGEVVWYCGEAAFLVECDREIFRHFDEIREVEVLGNIYKTPEILKDKQCKNN